MSLSLKLYNDILFLSLRPWNFGKQSDIKFKQLLLEVKKQYYTRQPIYEVKFVKPLSNIRKYYHAIIEYEAIQYLNYLHADITAALSDAEQHYLIHIALNKVISQKIKEVALVIQERAYTPEQFDLSQQPKFNDPSIANESYILHLLKYHLVRLIMEIQDSYQNYLREDALSPDEIYYKYFNETAPESAYIIEAENYPNTAQAVPRAQQKNSKPAFKSIRDDIWEDGKNIYTYNQLITNASRFAQIEEQLYENEIIDSNYQFIDKHGMKKFLSAYYHQLLRKGYFRKRILPGNIIVKNLDARKFLDHRYKTNVDKQFRIWDNDQEGLLKFIETNYWLDNISAC